jgi:predicted DNA-binding transcriptional regulator AlpA
MSSAAAQQVAVASKLLDVGEMSAIYGMSKRTIFRLADQGVLPRGIRLGGSRRWLRCQVDEHLDKLAASAN